MVSPPPDTPPPPVRGLPRAKKKSSAAIYLLYSKTVGTSAEPSTRSRNNSDLSITSVVCARHKCMETARSPLDVSQPTPNDEVQGAERTLGRYTLDSARIALCLICVLSPDNLFRARAIHRQLQRAPVAIPSAVQSAFTGIFVAHRH